MEGNGIIMNLRNIQRKDYLVSAIIFFASFMTGILCSYINIQIISDYLLKAAFIVLIIGEVYYFKRQYSFWNSVFYSFVFGTLALFWNLSYLKCSLEPQYISNGNAIIGLIGLDLSAFLWIYRVIRAFKEAITKEKVLYYIPLFIICIVYIMMFFLNYSVWFTIDSTTYYLSVADNAGTWGFTFADITPFFMGGHTSFAYSVLLTLGELICPINGYGQRTVNLVLSILTIVAFYKICEKIWDKKDRVRNTLLTMIFAYGPLFYGISYLHDTDFPLLCFFVLFFLASFYRVNAFKYLMIICICFSKEIGVFILAGTYIGEWVIECWGRKEKRWSGYIKGLFSWKRLMMYSPAFVYIYTLFFIDGGWAQNFRRIFEKNNSAAEIPLNTYTWWHYPILKIFECFFMNFYWVVWIVFGILLICIFKYCRTNRIKVKEYLIEVLKGKVQYYIPLIFTYVFFLVVGIAYLTYIHYRYVQLGQLFFVLFLGGIIDCFPHKKRKQKYLLAPILGLFLLQSFIAIDPVTNMVLEKYDAGNGVLPSTRKYWYIVVDENNGDGYYWEAEDDIMARFRLAEGNEINREKIGLQKGIENAFSDIEYKENKLIVLDDFGEWIENTCGQLFGIMDDSGWFWDDERKTVVRYETENPINIVDDSVKLDEYKDVYEEIYYFDFPFNEYYQNNILEENKPVEEHDEEWGRWKFKVYRLW